MPTDFGKDLYGGEEPTGQDSATSPDRDDKHAEGKTVLVNDDICPGLKPGDPLHLRVVQTEDKQYVCEYDEEAAEPEKGGARDGEMASTSEGAGSMNEMYS